jgi:predicted transcriptional regulator
MTKRNRNQGELESAVLDVLWAASDAIPGSQLSSQEILERLAPNGELALTTVLTVLSRLVDKQLVLRQPGPGRSLLFSPATSKAEHDAGLLLKIFEASDNPMLAFSHFAKSLDPQQLSQIKRSLGDS